MPVTRLRAAHAWQLPTARMRGACDAWRAALAWQLPTAWTWPSASCAVAMQGTCSCVRGVALNLVLLAQHRTRKREPGPPDRVSCKAPKAASPAAAMRSRRVTWVGRTAYGRGWVHPGLAAQRNLGSQTMPNMLGEAHAGVMICGSGQLKFSSDCWQPA